MAVYTWETKAGCCEFTASLVYVENLGLKEKQKEEKGREEEEEEKEFRSIRKF